MKSLKKIAAGALAAVAALGMAGLGATTASAADNASLTVSTADASFAGKTVNAYRMFDATVNGDAVAYTLNSDWEAFFSTSGLSDINCSDKTGAELNTCAYDAVSKLGDASNPTIDAFAQKASNWAQTKKVGSDPAAANASVAETATVSDQANDQGNYTASFSSLAYGYYLVAVPGVGNVNTANKYATLVPVTKAADTTATIKGSLPTVDKKVNVDGNAADTTNAKVGDTLTFTLTSTIPDMSAYDTYAFNFKDTLSAGLTFGSITSVVVKGAGQNGADITLEQGNDADAKDYTVTAPTADNNNLLTVTMNDFKAKQQANAGKSIVVTYTATLNENAVVGGEGNTNSATVEYSNNPLTGGKGESTPDIVRVYTYQFGIDKYTVKTGETGHTQLAGAKFTLTAKGGADAIKFVVKTTGSDTGSTVYRVAKDGETGATTELVTPASGRIDLTGLAKGEYVLTETEAPAGYNKLTKSIGVKVDGTEPTDGTDAAATITYTTDYTETNTTYDQTAANGIIGVENTTGPTLPGTGGMGTVLFTVFGVLIVALGAGWYVKSNRGKSRHSA
ncbi:SpaH/EbpB family LPXTG-anchored major pilin [Bifidobacterium jacchi]|uniref:Isopeptide-forming domain-containing fimbrial protein n=1 Tax=Bifidobacterium jacchi TaxID=2490545 RepID=A0A5N5RGC3_9BIFI|nr:SpaH/EbpB family LPXTG-anchored major pilin [Bifidobacterium jacchi]KAB5606316.1 isopeptide-forming domain-containing fimbrial protein [Bifidobacterium jacchi]